MNVGNGSNISIPGLAAGLTLDTSLFETTGVVTVTVIPEPSTLLLMGLTLGTLLIYRRRR